VSYTRAEAIKNNFPPVKCAAHNKMIEKRRHLIINVATC